MKNVRQKRAIRSLPSYYLNPIQDLFIDFALGVRVNCISDTRYKVQIYDDYTGILHHSFYTKKNKQFYSDVKFYIRWLIKIYKDGQLVYQHRLNLKDQKVIIEFPGIAIGDFLAAIGTIQQFQIKHQCDLYLFMYSQELIDIVKDQYPNIKFVSSVNMLSEPCYAYYLMSIGNMMQPTINLADCRLVGLEYTFSYLLNIPQEDIQKAKLNLSAQRQIKDKYVVINTSASGHGKEWIKDRWIEVVKYLKSLGYIVYQVGLEEQLIDGCIDLIGNIHLQKRIDLIKYADMFIGLSSGLSWIAYSCNVPVVMICNLTLPRHQFYTKYRVQPTIGCKGCFHQITPTFINICQNTNQFECKTNITVKQVCNTIDKVIKDIY